jgi:hypothetical protein
MPGKVNRRMPETVTVFTGWAQLTGRVFKGSGNLLRFVNETKGLRLRCVEAPPNKPDWNRPCLLVDAQGNAKCFILSLTKRGV